MHHEATIDFRRESMNILLISGYKIIAFGRGKTRIKTLRISIKWLQIKVLQYVDLARKEKEKSENSRSNLKRVGDQEGVFNERLNFKMLIG